MITADGWIDWAEKLRPTNNNVNPGVNTVKGAFFHSAEGYASVLLDPNSQYGYNGNLSWHASNLMDGRFIQHYPLTARCWHATAANNDYIGVESEGYQPNEKTLTDAQIDNLVRLTKDLEQWRGWKGSRPKSATDLAYTLWEHREVVKLGGTGTTCPNGRIPWDEILKRLGGPAVTPDEELELADRRALALAIDAMSFGQGGEGGIYRPVAVAEANGQLLIELWTRDRKRPAEPVPSFWVKKP